MLSRGLTLLWLLCHDSWASLVLLDLTSQNGFKWQVSSAQGDVGPIPGHVPGGIYTDLKQALILDSGHLFYRFNDQNYRWVAYQNWTYRLVFDVDPSLLDYGAIDLLLKGVDTAAEIKLNNRSLGRTENMFVCYRFGIEQILKAIGNELRVEFQSAVTYAQSRFEQQLTDYLVPPRCVPADYQGECHANHIRKMQASFGWDWGPAFPSVGLWRPVSIEAYQTLTLRDVVVETLRNGSLWQLDLRMHCQTAGVQATHVGTWDIRLTSHEDLVIMQRSVNASITGDSHRQGSVRLQFYIAVNQIEVWMPNGYGTPTLYRLDITYTEHGRSVFDRQMDIGFRTVALVQDELDTGGRTFYIKVNDVAVYLKGSNWIPADVLPESASLEYVRELLTACKEANMNALRVWGGGLYESDEFYQMADRLGIMIWQDFLFACSMYPISSWFLDTVSVEVTQNVRRLQYHPSIILWAGNNENEAALRGNWYGTVGSFNLYRQDYVKLYVDTIRPIVQREDPHRPFVVSSPSNGMRSEEEGHIAQNPYSDLYGDVHHYNYYVNAWNWTSYPKPRMATEYGFQSLPSVHAWAEAADPLDADDWSYNGALLKSRQHHPLGNFEMDLQIEMRLGAPRQNSSRQEFLDRIYLTQMHQAQAIKIQTEHYRRFRYKLEADGSGLTMAALYWQLNDIWQAPSWASIEYGGRWKPLHYFAVRFFAPLIFLLIESPDGQVAAYPHYDRPEDLMPGTLKIFIHSWEKLEPVDQIDVIVPQNWNAGDPVWSEPLNSLLNRTECSRETCFISCIFLDQSGQASAPDNELYLTSFPRVTNMKKATVQISAVSDIYISDKSPWTVDVTLSTDQIAPFVWIDTVSGRRGTFSENGFLLRQSVKSVAFYSKSEIQNVEAFQADLNIMHLTDIIL